MLLLKIENDESTIKGVCVSDFVIGIVGSVEDLLKSEILTYCEYSPETWCFLPFGDCKPYFAKYKSEIIEYIQERY